MATYTELRALFSDDALKNRTDMAVVVAANNLIGGTPTVNDQKWSSGVFGNPRSEGVKALMAVLATHKDLTTTQITTASDAALQAAVDSAVPSLVIAYAG